MLQLNASRYFGALAAASLVTLSSFAQAAEDQVI